MFSFTVVPPDGGWGWVVVAACFVCNLVVDGIIFSGGMLLEHIQKEFQITNSQVAPVNSLLAGFYLLTGPIVSALSNKYGFRLVTIIGSIIASVAFVISYFATCVEYLYFFYGIVGGIGFCMIYLPAVVTPGFYFEKWRALATGLALCGSGVGTFVFAPLNDFLLISYGWRATLLVHAALVLLCIICGAMLRPIKPTRVMIAEQQEEEDMSRRREVPAEKLNSLLKLQSKLDTPKPTLRPFRGLTSRTRYPTAEEVLKGSISHISRRSSATAGTLKSTLENKPTPTPVPKSEKVEQEITNMPVRNTGTEIREGSGEYKSRKSNADSVAGPMDRDDIFYGASLTKLPQYTSKTSLGYHRSVTRLPAVEDAPEERSRKCRCCPESVKRTLATMLDISLFRSPTFVILALNGFFTVLGLFVPFMYVKQRAESFGMDPTTSVMLVSSIGIMNIIGRIACGVLSAVPRLSPLWVVNIAITAGALATMFSGFSFTPAYQFSCCLIFGLAVACFASLRSILVVKYIGLNKLTNCFGLFILFQGMGALLGSPIAGALMDYTKSYDISFYVSGTFLLISAVICYPVDCISRWEKKRNKSSSNSEARNSRTTFTG